MTRRMTIVFDVSDIKGALERQATQMIKGTLVRSSLDFLDADETTTLDVNALQLNIEVEVESDD